MNLKRASFRVVSAVLGGAVAGWILFSFPAWVDDAFIEMTYARHWVEGGGFYWNRADGPLDGFTSFFDLVVKAVVARATRGDWVSTFEWVNWVFFVFCGLFAFGFVVPSRRSPASTLTLACGLAASLAVVSSRGLAWGSAFLLETPLYVALSLAVVGWTLQNERWSWSRSAWLALSALALMLTRPEGVITVAAAFLWAFVDTRRGKREQRLRPVAAALVAGLGWLTYLLWHHHAFGTWAPNTYFNKTTDSHWTQLLGGFEYLLAHPSNAVVLLAPGFCFASFTRPDERKRYRFLVTLTLALVLGVVLEGGDRVYLSLPRFMALPQVISILALSYAAVRAERWHWLGTGVVGALALLQLVGLGWNLDREDPTYDPVRAGRIHRRAGWPLSERNFRLNRYIGSWFESFGEVSVAADADQSLKFFGEGLRVIDLSGLNDRQIAHSSWHGPINFGKGRTRDLLDRAPPFAIMGASWMRREPVASIPLGRALATAENREHFFDGGTWKHVAPPTPEEQAALAARYVTASLPICGRFFNFMVRSDFAAQAARSGAWIEGLSTEQEALQRAHERDVDLLCRVYATQYYYFFFQAKGLIPWPGEDTYGAG